MKTKQILTASLTAGILALSVTACGGSGASTSTGAAEPSGETVNVGTFTTYVPDGWLKYAQQDYNQAADKDGNYPANQNAYAMIKGGKSEIDCLEMPTLYVYYIDSAPAEEEAELVKLFYEETTDISVMINGVECAAFEGKSSSIYVDGEYDVYDFVFLPVDDSSCIQFNIPINVFTSAEDEPVGVDINDADVQAILNGTAMN